jgi:hypothetical protein
MTSTNVKPLRPLRIKEQSSLAFPVDTMFISDLCFILHFSLFRSRRPKNFSLRGSALDAITDLIHASGVPSPMPILRHAGILAADAMHLY